MIAIKYEDLLMLMKEKFPQNFKDTKENRVVIEFNNLEHDDIEEFQYIDGKMVVATNDLRIFFSGNSQEGRVMSIEFIEEKIWDGN